MAEHSHRALIQFASALSAALQERDAYTRYHSERVMKLAGEMGRRIGLTANELGMLRAASALHDIGKIGIPDEVLLKPGKLDPEERVVMQSHSTRGAHIVLALDRDGADVVASIVKHHHEAYDGSGYPDGLAGERIPVLSRIISIVDGYDAMATRRIYQEARRHSAIIDEMLKDAGGKLDPVLFELFLKVIDTSESRVQ